MATPTVLNVVAPTKPAQQYSCCFCKSKLHTQATCSIKKKSACKFHLWSPQRSRVNKSHCSARNHCNWSRSANFFHEQTKAVHQGAALVLLQRAWTREPDLYYTLQVLHLRRIRHKRTFSRISGTTSIFSDIARSVSWIFMRPVIVSVNNCVFVAPYYFNRVNNFLVIYKLYGYNILLVYR